MLETCFTMVFSDFQRQLKRCQSYFANCSWKPINRKIGHSTTLSSLRC